MTLNPDLTSQEIRELTEELVWRLLGPSNAAVDEIYARLGYGPFAIQEPDENSH